jgi:Arc/MetJ-type ribon-helix-helix transcriptional regulator
MISKTKKGNHLTTTRLSPMMYQKLSHLIEKGEFINVSDAIRSLLRNALETKDENVFET